MGKADQDCFVFSGVEIWRQPNKPKQGRNTSYHADTLRILPIIRFEITTYVHFVIVKRKRRDADLLEIVRYNHYQHKDPCYCQVYCCCLWRDAAWLQNCLITKMERQVRQLAIVIVFVFVFEETWCKIAKLPLSMFFVFEEMHQFPKIAR